MERLLRMLVLALGVMAIGAAGEARAQAPAPAPTPPPIEGNVYTVIYVEVMPTSKSDATLILRRYREATRKEGGNLRCEAAQRIDQPHQFVILSIWKDQKAWEAHGKGAPSMEMREKVAAIRNAPTDERIHSGLSAGPLPPAPGRPPRGPSGGPLDAAPVRDPIYVATHVDVIPPQKDNGVAALRKLGEESRKGDGNLRFGGVQKNNRLNHFTVVEIWKDAKAVETHSMAAATREFRDKLASMTGALYDER